MFKVGFISGFGYFFVYDGKKLYLFILVLENLFFNFLKKF
jgi:hypothetical protein